MNVAKLWESIIRFCWVALIVLSAVGVSLIFAPKWRALRELQRKKTALEEENRGMERAAMEFRLRQHRFATDPAFVERTARENGMVKSNEAVFRMSKEDPHAGGAKR